MPAGRPTGYRPEYCDQIVAYFSEDLTRVIESDKGPKLVPNELPTLAGFAWKIGVSKVTLWNWSKAHPEFLNAIKECESIQEHKLSAGAAMGIYKEVMSIFQLKNNHGYKDKSEVLNRTAYEDMSDDELDAEIRRRQGA